MHFGGCATRFAVRQHDSRYKSEYFRNRQRNKMLCHRSRNHTSDLSERFSSHFLPTSSPIEIYAAIDVDAHIALHRINRIEMNQKKCAAMCARCSALDRISSHRFNALALTRPRTHTRTQKVARNDIFY